MEKTFFTMKPRMQGLLKYMLMSLIPSIVVGLLMDWDAAIWVFIPLGTVMLFPRAHMVVVFDHAFMEKATWGSKRFICKIPAERIDHYRRNSLDEIILEDADGRRLLCAESHLSERDRFLNWLAAHNIESK